MTRSRREERLYRKPITHRQRTAIVFLVDCTLSMLQPGKVGALVMPKYQIVELMCNLMIDELVIRATKHGAIRNYYDIAALGYSGDGVQSLLPGDSEGFIAVDRLVDLTPQPKTMVIKHYIKGNEPSESPMTYHGWIEPKPFGTTSMVEGLVNVYMLTERWCRNLDNRENFPPMVFHFTDGAYNEADKADIIDLTSRIKNSYTLDGDTLLFNIHLSSADDNYSSAFHTNRGFKTASYERRLMFDTASMVPKSLESYVSYIFDIDPKGPYRATLFNVSACELISLLNIGTESVNNKRYL